MNRALMAGGGVIGAKGVLQSLFATQVATGSGLTGAAASLSAISTGAVAATAGIAALVGTLGWVAYKTWKIKEAKDAVLEEIESNRKYRYPSIEALYSSLSETYNMAVKTKRAVDEVVAGKVSKRLRDIKSEPSHPTGGPGSWGNLPSLHLRGWYRETMCITWTKPVRMT